MFDISVRRDDSRGHRLTPIGIQLDARRKGFLGRSINVRRNRPQLRPNTGRNGFTTIDVQLDARRKSFLGRSINVRRNQPRLRPNTGRNGFTTVDVQLDTRRKSFLSRSINVRRDCLNSSLGRSFVQSHVPRRFRRVRREMMSVGVVCHR